MSSAASDLQKKNQKVLVTVFTAVFIMIGVSFAVVPLYDLFCRVTGFGGTTQISEGPSGEVIDRPMSVSFTANVGRGMPWDFAPAQRRVELKPGEKVGVSYIAKNPTDKAITGTSLYNVSPSKAGQYFHKTQCFCFQEKTLMPGEEAEMGIVFYIDPAIADDPNLDDVSHITLSYTFFEVGTAELDNALEDFYNQ